MKKLLTITLALTVVLFATNALAERGHRWDGNDHAVQGKRIERHMDRTGDRIQHRFEHKAERAEDRGHYRQAERFRTKGERINRHLDRQGHRIHARFDHHNHRHDHDRRHHHVRERVVYHAPYGSYLGVVINQPGFRLGWGWYD